MANQKQNFTADMRKATGPTNPPGGSKLVRGREPIVVGQANMMSSFAVDRTDEALSPTHQSSGTSPATLPSSGFFDEEYVRGKRTVSSPANPESAEGLQPLKRTNQTAAFALANEASPKRANQTAVATNRSPPVNMRLVRAADEQTDIDWHRAITMARAPWAMDDDDSIDDPSASKAHGSEDTSGSDMTLPDRALAAVGEPHPAEAERFTAHSWNIDLESLEERRALSTRICRALASGCGDFDFQRQHVPSYQRNAGVHDALSAMMTQREDMEAAMTELMTDRYPDGKRKVRDEGAVDKEYGRTEARWNACNRAMMAMFARFLSAERDGPAAGSAFSATDVDPANSELICPYSHMRDHPAPPQTIPTFGPIVIEAIPDHALLTHHASPARGPPSPDAVWAIADSGASHILIRKADVDVLTSAEYTPTKYAPVAVLKTANGAPLAAIGQGILTIGSLRLPAYVFKDSDLMNNLLGVAPLADRNCTAVFGPSSFQVYRNDGPRPLLSGTRDSSQSLWLVNLSAVTHQLPESDGIPPPHPVRATGVGGPTRGIYMEANHVARHDNASYVRFIHACLGYPAPTTFLRAVTAGYIMGTHQFPRLTAKMVRKHLPNATATAKGHLDQTPSSLPHAQSDAVSALRRLELQRQHAKLLLPTDRDKPFSLDEVPRSTLLHVDYTGPLPETCSSGTRYFQVSCHGGYINIQPLSSLRHTHTTVALRRTVEFFRGHGVIIDTIRMDNQRSQPLLDLAASMNLRWELVPPFVKNPNRAERAIRTAKNHIIATRAGFHPDCPHTYLDKCLTQIELTLNIVRPFDYDPTKSAYEGLTGCSYNFDQHPIAPVGAKVLTWDSPTHRGTWADHGVEAVYLGPAENHLRAFEVWVPNTSAPRITNTVWWFLHHKVEPNTPLIEPSLTLAYPPSKVRPNPRDDGTDLIGRAFFEPELGVCIISGAGPVVHNQMATRARRRRNRTYNEPLIQPGEHYTLHYKQTTTGEDNFSSVAEILHWIETGPFLQPPVGPVTANQTDAPPITTPSYVPAKVQYVPNLAPPSLA